MSGSEREAEGYEPGMGDRFMIRSTPQIEFFLNQLSPVTQDVWRRRLKKGRLSKDHKELFEEMYKWFWKERDEAADG